MNDFIWTIDGFRKRKVYYTDTDSIYIHRSDMEILEREGLVSDDLGKGKNDFGEDTICFRALFLGPKQKICYTISKGKIDKKVTLKGAYGERASNLNRQEIDQIATDNLLIEREGLQKKIWQSSVNGSDLDKGSGKIGVFTSCQHRTINTFSQQSKMIL